jgi:LPXTG-motif cell wall-anchored protein
MGGGSDSGDKGGSSKKGVNTGDENALGAWIVLMLAALAGTTGMVFARKRKG